MGRRVPLPLGAARGDGGVDLEEAERRGVLDELGDEALILQYDGARGEGVGDDVEERLHPPLEEKGDRDGGGAVDALLAVDEHGAAAVEGGAEEGGGLRAMRLQQRVRRVVLRAEE